MRKALAVALSVVFAAVAAEERNPRTSPADVEAGAKTFRSHCAACHGMHGEGGRGPNLAAGVFYHGSTDEDLLRNISSGINGTEMPGLFYSPDRVWQVVAYIRSLNAGNAPAPPGDVNKGKAVFNSSGCANCHRIAGEGGRLGPDLTQIGAARSPDYLRQSILDPGAVVAPRYWVVSMTLPNGEKQSGFLLNEDTYSVQFIDFKEQLHSYLKSELKDYKVDKISKMPSYRGKLSNEDLGDLVAYLSSLRPSGGAQ